MSRDEVKQIIMAIISAYLAWIGVRLVRDYKPGMKPVYLIGGIVFIAFGAFALVTYVRRLLRLRRRQSERDLSEEPEPPVLSDTDEEEPVPPVLPDTDEEEPESSMLPDSDEEEQA